MTITLTIIGNKKDIETFANAKFRGAILPINQIKNKIDKALKSNFDHTGTHMEDMICGNHPKYTLTFTQFGCCELPAQKKVKPRKKK